jgi:hypothetical protein
MSVHRRTLPFALALLLLPAAAWAQAPVSASEADRTAARELATEGKAALERKDYSVAADRFARAGSLVHAPTLVLGLARAQAGLGKWIVATELYRGIVREGVARDAPPAFVRALKDAQTELDALDPRVPGVIIDVKGTARVVTLDGVVVPGAGLGVKHRVDPGRHVIRAEAGGQAPAEATVTVAEGKVETVTLALAPALQDGPSLQRTLGFVAVGVGGAALLVGAITGGLAIAKHGDLAKACPDPHLCTNSEISSYDTLGGVSTVAFVFGGALAVTSIVLLVTAPDAKPATEAAVVPVLGPGWVGAKGRF